MKLLDTLVITLVLCTQMNAAFPFAKTKEDAVLSNRLLPRMLPAGRQPAAKGNRNMMDYPGDFDYSQEPDSQPPGAPPIEVQQALEDAHHLPQQSRQPNFALNLEEQNKGGTGVYHYGTTDRSLDKNMPQSFHQEIPNQHMALLLPKIKDPQTGISFDALPHNHKGMEGPAWDPSHDRNKIPEVSSLSMEKRLDWHEKELKGIFRSVIEGGTLSNFDKGRIYTSETLFRFTNNPEPRWLMDLRSLFDKVQRGRSRYLRARKGNKANNMRIEKNLRTQDALLAARRARRLRESKVQRGKGPQSPFKGTTGFDDSSENFAMQSKTYPTLIEVPQQTLPQLSTPDRSLQQQSNFYPPRSDTYQPQPDNPHFQSNTYQLQSDTYQPQPDNPHFQSNTYQLQSDTYQPQPDNPHFQPNTYQLQSDYNQPQPGNPYLQPNAYQLQSDYDQPQPGGFQQQAAYNEQSLDLNQQNRFDDQGKAGHPRDQGRRLRQRGWLAASTTSDTPTSALPQNPSATAGRSDIQSYIIAFKYVKSNATNAIWPFLEEMLEGTNSSLIISAAWSIYSHLIPTQWSVIGPFYHGSTSLPTLNPNYTSNNNHTVMNNSTEIWTYEDLLINQILIEVYRRAWSGAYKALSEAGCLENMDALKGAFSHLNISLPFDDDEETKIGQFFTKYYQPITNRKWIVQNNNTESTGMSDLFTSSVFAPVNRALLKDAQDLMPKDWPANISISR